MSYLQALVLGLVQGLTEFLPISSDGHLAITYQLFHTTPDLTYEVFLHGATLIAMYAYFGRDIIRILRGALPGPRPTRRASAAVRENAEQHARERADNVRLLVLIAVGTLASGIVAKAIEPIVEPMASSLTWVALWFMGTAALLAIGERLALARTRAEATARLFAPIPQPTPANLNASAPVHAGLVDPENPATLTIPRTLFIGLMQGLAVLPGLSRSGSTIAASMIAGLDRERAARFSFLIGIPIITAAFGLDIIDVVRNPGALTILGPAGAGFIVAGISGYAAVAGLLTLVKRYSLNAFAAYTACVSVILFAVSVFARG